MAEWLKAPIFRDAPFDSPVQVSRVWPLGCGVTGVGVTSEEPKTEAGPVVTPEEHDCGTGQGAFHFITLYPVGLLVTRHLVLN